MGTWIDDVNRYANLIMVLVTAIYAGLTYWMVQEMRRTREEESNPHLVVTLVPLGRMFVKLRVVNVGGGTARNVELSFRFRPAENESPRHWRHPAMLPGEVEEFRLPGSEFALEKLAQVYERIIVDLKWSRGTGRAFFESQEFDLKSMLAGWTDLGNLVKPDDERVQLHKIHEELAKIRAHLDSANSRRQFHELLEESGQNQNAAAKQTLLQRIVELIEKLWRRT